MLDPRVQLLRSHFCKYVSFKIIQRNVVVIQYTVKAAKDSTKLPLTEGKSIKITNHFLGSEKNVKLKTIVACGVRDLF